MLSCSRGRRSCWGGGRGESLISSAEAAARPSALTKGRGPRTRLSLQARRTRPNPSATAETATPLSPPLPSGPVASMTPLVHARRSHPLPSLLHQPRPRVLKGHCARLAARGCPGQGPGCQRPGSRISGVGVVRSAWGMTPERTRVAAGGELVTF